jgi:hypothetical protein
MPCPASPPSSPRSPLFQVITERDEKASIGLASNLPFANGAQSSPDPRLVAAIVDRVTFNAHILETGTQSYWLAASKTRRPQAADRLTATEGLAASYAHEPPADSFGP